MIPNISGLNKQKWIEEINHLYYYKSIRWVAMFVLQWKGEATELNDSKHTIDYNTQQTSDPSINQA